MRDRAKGIPTTPPLSANKKQQSAVSEGSIKISGPGDSKNDALSGSVEDDAGMRVWEMLITVRCQQSTEPNVKRLR